MYKKIAHYDYKGDRYELTDSIFRVSDSAQIPFDNNNVDYQEYLKWLEEGNEPLPADE